MKAAVLNAFGSPLAIETVPEPAAWHRRGHRRRRGEPCAGLRQRGAQRGTKIPFGTAYRARPRRDRPHPRHRPRRDPASSRRLGLLRSDRALTRQCAVARHRPAGPDRRQRGRPAPATLFPRRRLGRTNAAADGKRGSDRRHRREGRRPMVRARHAAGALWRVPRRATCRPERSCWSMAPPAVSAAPPSPSRWEWARSVSSRPGGTSRR